nr:hypothetical protein [Pandoravirus massiliensis]
MLLVPCRRSHVLSPRQRFSFSPLFFFFFFTNVVAWEALTGFMRRISTATCFFSKKKYLFFTARRETQTEAPQKSFFALHFVRRKKGPRPPYLFFIGKNRNSKEMAQAPTQTRGAPWEKFRQWERDHATGAQQREALF